MAHKIKISTCSLGGCFGCHMSILDIDEKLIELAGVIEFTRTPLTDIKQITQSDIGIIEGGVCNLENLEVLTEYRQKTKVLVAMGACAITGGLPAMRNQFSLKECLDESYVNGVGIINPHIPNDPEIPLLLDKVHPLHETVKIDYFLPGCPPAAESIWTFLQSLIKGEPVDYAYQQIHYD